MKEKIKEAAMKYIKMSNIKLAVICLIVVIVGIRGFFFVFEDKGTVKSISGSVLTIINFWGTKTIDVQDFPLDKSIYPGDKVLIKKNIFGDIMEVKGYGDRWHGRKYWNRIMGFRKGFNNNRAYFKTPDTGYQGEDKSIKSGASSIPGDSSNKALTAPVIKKNNNEVHKKSSSSKKGLKRWKLSYVPHKGDKIPGFSGPYQKKKGIN